MIPNNHHTNPFDKITGSANLANPRGLLLFFIGVSLVAVILAKLEIAGVGLVLALMFGAVFLNILFKNPIIGFYTAIGLNFVLLGSLRYITTELPIGFAIDGIMTITFLALIKLLLFLSCANKKSSLLNI